MEPTWVLIISTLASVFTATAEKIVEWFRGKKKTNAEGNKAQVEATSVLTDFYKEEITYLKTTAEAHLKALEDAEHTIGAMASQSCLRTDCKDRIKTVRKSNLKD